MKKYISFFYGYNSNYKERVKMIKDNGFDGVMAMYKFSPHFYDECEEIQKSGLEIDSLHLPFKGVVNHLWRSDKKSRIFTDLMQEGISYAADNNIKKVTIHTSSSPFPPPKNNEGLKRFIDICNFAHDKSIVVCVENLRRPDYFTYIVDNTTAEDCMICFDSGHANAFWKDGLNGFPFEKYKSRIVCCHLHDNFGRFDSHNMPFNGNIDWQKTAYALSLSNIDGLTLELTSLNKKITQIPEVDFLKKGMDSLKKIEKMM